MTRRLSEALRSASDALAVAADASREGSSTSSGHGEDSHDDYCCEKHRRLRHHCGALCPHCGVHLEHRSCSHDEAPESHSHEKRSESKADERETCCEQGQAAPLPPYPPYPPVPAHAPHPPYPPFPPYPPYIIIAPGSGCGCHQAAASTPMPVYGGPPPSQAGPPATNTIVARPSSAPGVSPPQDSLISAVAPSFPDPSRITDLDALLDLGERAVATMRELLPTEASAPEEPHA